MDINQRIARRIGELRIEKGLSVEDLANRSGVSRAMVYRIEGGDSSPTATVLSKLAIGLGVLLPELFGPARLAEPRLRRRDPVSSRRAQPVWKDTESGYERRTLTPSTANQSMQLSEIRFPPGARVTFENAFGMKAPLQQIWLLEGNLELRIGGEETFLKPGDCIAMKLDRPTTFSNPGGKTARYLVAAIVT